MWSYFFNMLSELHVINKTHLQLNEGIELHEIIILQDH